MIHNLKQLINANFPFDTYNPGQYEAIESCVIALMQNKKHVILSCPTGVGKSVIAMTIYKTVSQLRHNKQETIVLTTTKGLQDQYVHDFPFLLDLKGKNNYYCHHDLAEKYNSVECIAKVKSGQCSHDKCEYVIKKNQWVNLHAAKTTNSHMMIRSGDNLIESINPADLLIIDECHSIDKVIISQAQVLFSVDMCPELFAYYEGLQNDFAKLMTTMLNTFKTEGENDIQDIKPQVESFVSALKQKQSQLSNKENKDSKFDIMEFEIKDLLDKLFPFYAASYKDLRWVLDVVLNEMTTKDTLIFTPTSTSGVLSHTKLFNKASQFLHMSATIGGLSTYCYNLGVNLNDVEYIEIDNPIDIKRRQILLYNTIKMNMHTEISEIKKTLLPVIKTLENSGNGIIHTVSFKLANDIFHSMPLDIKKRMLVSNNRKKIMAELEKNDNRIILSPSIETGYDFKGDLARWQIIAKVPYLNLGDNYTKTRMQKSSLWYQREAILRIIQACGRIVRGLDDKGVTIITDQNILNLITQNESMFPKWWLDALIISNK